MSFTAKLVKELKSIFWVSLYFFIWFGAMIFIKYLLLQEYSIQFSGIAIIVVGTLVAAKVVLILEHVPLIWARKQVALIEIFMRSILYLAGVVVIMLLEKSFEAREEYGGFFNALMSLKEHVNVYQITADFICVFGALLVFNAGAHLKDVMGVDGLRKAFLTKPTSKKG